MNGYYIARSETTSKVYFIDTRPEVYSVEKWDFYKFPNALEHHPICCWKRYYDKHQFKTFIKQTEKEGWVRRDVLMEFGYPELD
jgi:hypothetical protein